MNETTSSTGEPGSATSTLELLPEAAQAATEIGADQQQSQPAAPAKSSSSSGVLGWLFGGLTGVTDFLPNAGLVLLGVVLGVGALLVSQKQTIVKVAAKAGELGL